MNTTLFPGSVWGQVDIPASKSQTIHALLIALFSRGVSTITNPLLCSDTQACLDFCTKLGATIRYSDETMVVDSTNLTPRDGLEIDCKNSGTTLYFATALACTLGVDIKFNGDGSLQRRPVRPLLASLHDLGANADPDIENAPYSVCGPLTGGHTSIRCMTGQFLTALMLAAPLAKEDTTIDVFLLRERSAVRTTEIWLEKQGIDFFRDDDMNHYTVRGGQSYRPLETDINGDFSLAAFFFCAAAITGSTITITHLDAKSSQADREILDILSEMGCSVRSEGHTVTLTGPSRLKAIDIDMSGIPDLLSALAVTSCFASGPVRLTNISHNVSKGSGKRSSIITSNINALGGQVQELPDSLVIYPAHSLCGGVSVQCYDDPRIAMAMALASLRCTQGLTIEGCECVDELYPGFFDDFRSVTLSER
jgi:3-phosphoshikimate 1-carboxyvinyltransferase